MNRRSLPRSSVPPRALFRLMRTRREAAISALSLCRNISQIVAAAGRTPDRVDRQSKCSPGGRRARPDGRTAPRAIRAQLPLIGWSPRRCSYTTTSAIPATALMMKVSAARAIPFARFAVLFGANDHVRTSRKSLVGRYGNRCRFGARNSVTPGSS